MKNIRVGAAVLNQTPLDWTGNTRNILDAIGEALKQKVRVLCLPELAVSGYGCEDAFHSPSTASQSLEELEKIIPATAGIAVCIGLPLFLRSNLFNAVAVICDKVLLGFVCKRILAGQGVYYEQRWFKPWPEGEQREIECLGRTVAVGDLIFSLGDVRIGVEICEDAWSHDRPARAFAAKEVDLILNPSASHFSFGKLEVRKQIILESSRFCNAATVFTNLNGCEAGRLIYDGGALIASCGKLLRQGKRFTYQPVDVTAAQIDLDHIKLERARNTHAPLESASRDFRTVKVSFDWSCEPFEKPRNDLSPWETSKDLKEEEFTRAIGLALFDYMRKSKSRGFVVSLSGGIDSGSIALLVHYMLKQMAHELGETGLARTFEPWFGKTEPLTLPTLSKRILTCVYQSSRNSGEATLHAARTLAGALDFRFFHLDIQPLVDRYVHLAEQCVERKLDWDHDDTALQNIQARVRGPSVWLLANLAGALLLATGNRSEAAVGYATMDGDTCGGLSPLGGIDKHFLIRWIHWVERTGPTGLGSVPEVKWITRQKPTAELRPPEQDQQDETDLMPYALLDQIEKAFIRERKSPADILQSLVEPEQGPDHKCETAGYIKRFLRLWRQNQWKRERYAPSFHLDDESLDPRSSCRYPILSGDFQAEFEQLDREIP